MMTASNADEWLTDVEKRFKDRALIRGGLLLLLGPIAIELIQQCRESGVRVLGVDGFWITETTTQPDMSISLNLSDTAIEESWEAAESFIRERDQLGLYFEVVVASP